MAKLIVAYKQGNGNCLRFFFCVTENFGKDWTTAAGRFLSTD